MKIFMYMKDMKNSECVGAFFGVKGLNIPAIISAVMNAEAAE